MGFRIGGLNETRSHRVAYSAGIERSAIASSTFEAHTGDLHASPVSATAETGPNSGSYRAF